MNDAAKKALGDAEMAMDALWSGGTWRDHEEALRKIIDYANRDLMEVRMRAAEEAEIDKGSGI